MITQEQLELFKSKLETEYKRLTTELSHVSHITSDGKREADFVSLGTAEDEAGLEIQEFELNIDLKKKLSHDLELVEAALTRIHDGTYGVCLRCKNAISSERLMVLPEAELCNECSD